MFKSPFITAEFWSDAFTRCIRTFAQTLAAGLGGSALNVWNASWHQAVGLAAGSALLAVLMTADRWTAPASEVPKLVSGCGDDLR
jgi:hypothetical protein